VVVIPPTIAGEIAAEGPEHEELEVYIRELIEAGRPISEVYPPNEQVRAAFAARRGAGSGPAAGDR
jgi:regulator of RNase E activity RraA